MAKVKSNNYRIEEDTCYIDCYNLQGNVSGTIIIDSEDIPKVNKYNWHVEHSRKNLFYAQAINGNSTIRMHKIICPSDEQVDHINHNGLDNRKSNLRACSNRENNHNKRFSLNSKSGYTGIRYNDKCKSYYVRIQINKKDISLGAYKSLEEAIKARKDAEDKYYGDFKYKEEIK